MQININLNSRASLYKQISNQIKELILAEQLKQGESLPTIRDLAKTLDVSEVTVHKAYEILQHEGFTHAHAGKGTIVSNKGKIICKKLAERRLNESVRLAINGNIDLEEMRDLLEQLYIKQSEEKEKRDCKG